MSSFSLDNKTFEIDRLLFSYYHNLNWIKKWKLINSNLNYEIRTKLKVEITTGEQQTTMNKNENKKHNTNGNNQQQQQQQQQKSVNYNLMNINVKYKWPKLLSLNVPNSIREQDKQQLIHNIHESVSNKNDLNVIRFPLTQVGLFEMKNVTLSNPSNQKGLLIQLLFINNYPIENKNQLIEMLKTNSYDFNIDDYLDDIQQPGRRKQVTVEDLFKNDSTFSIHQSKLTSQGIVILNGKANKNNNNIQANSYNNKENLSFYLQKSQQITLQIQFQPFKKQIYSSILIIRNNLTIIDAYIIHGEGGSGELRLSNRKPNTRIPLILEMTTKQFKQCEIIKNRQKDLYIENEYENSEIIDNLTLRKSFKLKNHGNLNIFVNEIRIDKMKCSAFGFEIGTCRNILLEPNQTYELDIKYQPDYTMSKIIKELEFDTNLGIFRYEVHVKIPKTMLQTCHQVLPRPRFEKYFYYFAIILIIMFIFILIIVAIFESRNILRYHFETQNNLNEQHQKQVNLQEFVSEYQLQSRYILNSQKKTQTTPPPPTTVINKQNNKQQTATTTTTTTTTTIKPIIKTPINQTLSSPATIVQQQSTPVIQKPIISKTLSSSNSSITRQQQPQVTTTSTEIDKNKQINKKHQQPTVVKKEDNQLASKQIINETNLSTSSSSSNEQLNKTKKQQTTPIVSQSPPPPPISPSPSSSSSTSSSSSSSSPKQEFKLINQVNKNQNKKRKEVVASNEEQHQNMNNSNNNNNNNNNNNTKQPINKPVNTNYANRKHHRTANINDDEYDAKYTPPAVKIKPQIQQESELKETNKNQQEMFKIKNDLSFDDTKYQTPSKLICLL
jgi:hypothetical protein